MWFSQKNDEIVLGESDEKFNFSWNKLDCCMHPTENSSVTMQPCGYTKAHLSLKWFGWALKTMSSIYADFVKFKSTCMTHWQSTLDVESRGHAERP
jgi:hypothetical protein